MTRFSAVAGSARQWAAVLNTIDRGKEKLPRREMNWLLDDVIIAQDAEREARALRLDRLCRGSSSSRGPKP